MASSKPPPSLESPGSCEESRASKACGETSSTLLRSSSSSSREGGAGAAGGGASETAAAVEAEDPNQRGILKKEKRGAVK